MARRVVPLLIAVCLAISIGGGPAGAASSALTGQVVTPNGVPLADAVVMSGGEATVTDSEGRFLLEVSPPAEISVQRVAYTARSVSWDGAADWVTIPMVPRVVRGIHVAGWVAAEPDDFAKMLDLVDGTAVNAVIIDVKNENGRVYHNTNVAAAAGSMAADTFDMAAVGAQSHAAGAYVITRIVSFQDPIVAPARPAWSVIDRATGEPFNQKGQRFLDPWDPDARGFVLALAEEVCRAGVDEVQFDYVRFPAADLADARFDGPADAAGRQAAITSFLTEARALLQPLGCATAADIFGWITNTAGEGGIGQQLELISNAVDVVSPMMYPSHYSSGWYGFAVPNDHPGPVVTYASRDGLRRMARSQAVLRPWIQDFWYTAAQVREQINALDGLGLGWMSWNILSHFSLAAYPPDGVLTAGTSVPDVVGLELGTSGFWDVGDDHLYVGDVAWMAAAGVTQGCNPPYDDFYCPDRSVTRGEMAAFLVRGLGLAAGEDPGFVDDDGSVFVGDIAALAAAEVTRGCDPPINARYCPERAVTRGEMAAFLVRGLGLAAGEDPGFVDDDASVFIGDIASLAGAGITRGCDPPENVHFCPDRSVTRGEMAAFLHRALAGH